VTTDHHSCARITSANAHACEHLRSDILRASKFFPDTHALLTWLLDGVADDALGEQDRVG